MVFPSQHASEIVPVLPKHYGEIEFTYSAAAAALYPTLAAPRPRSGVSDYGHAICHG